MFCILMLATENIAKKLTLSNTIMKNISAHSLRLAVTNIYQHYEGYYYNFYTWTIPG